VVVLALGAWLARAALHAAHYEETDDAYVSGHLYQISPQINDQVLAVPVNDNQLVKAGDVLVRLDPLQFTLAVQKAQDQLEQARAQEAEAHAALAQADTEITEAEARVQQAAAELGQTEAELNLAKQNLDRSEQLFGDGGIIAQADLDKTRSVFHTATAAQTANQANLGAARAAVDSAHAARNSLAAKLGAATANVAVAQAALDDARRMLAYTTIIAPADGCVGNKEVEVGNYAIVGQSLLALASPDAWIVANFKETQLTRITPGQAAEVTLDTLPGVTLHGTVESLAPASGSQFALLPPDNATGNFNKVVQRVPVKIVLDKGSLAAAGPRLRLGLSVIVNVRVQ
jgi:membrane fusion protein (multidrug efflux system)